MHTSQGNPKPHSHPRDDPKTPPFAMRTPGATPNGAPGLPYGPRCSGGGKPRPPEDASPPRSSWSQRLAGKGGRVHRCCRLRRHLRARPPAQPFYTTRRPPDAWRNCRHAGSHSRQDDRCALDGAAGKAGRRRPRFERLLLEHGRRRCTIGIPRTRGDRPPAPRPAG